jgi:hypothetical protein
MQNRTIEDNASGNHIKFHEEVLLALKSVSCISRIELFSAQPHIPRPCNMSNGGGGGWFSSIGSALSNASSAVKNLVSPDDPHKTNTTSYYHSDPGHQGQGQGQGMAQGGGYRNQQPQQQQHGFSNAYAQPQGNPSPNNTTHNGMYAQPSHNNNDTGYKQQQQGQSFFSQLDAAVQQELYSSPEPRQQGHQPLSTGYQPSFGYAIIVCEHCIACICTAAATGALLLSILLSL